MVTKSMARLVVLALAALLFMGTPAWAFSLPPDSSLHFSILDFSNLFTSPGPGLPLVPLGIGAVPILGDEERAIGNVDAIRRHDLPGHPAIPIANFNPATENVNFVLYDIVVTAGAVAGPVVQLYFGAGVRVPYVDTAFGVEGPALPAAGFGGHADVYVDSPIGTPFTPVPGPGAWVECPLVACTPATAAKPVGGDSYPSINTGLDPDALVLEAVLVPAPIAPLPTLLLLGPPPAGTVMTLELDFGTGTGTGRMFLNAIGSLWSTSIVGGGNPITPGPFLDIALSFESDFPPSGDYDPTGAWQASSDDPSHFRVAEPSTLILVGGGLLGLALLGRGIRGGSDRRS